MDLQLLFIISAVWLIIGIFITRLYFFIRKPVPVCDGSLIIDESGNTERWTFIFDTPLDEVAAKKTVNVKIVHRSEH